MAQVDDYGWTEAKPTSSGYINRQIVTLVRTSGASTVLDAGCGNGALCGDLLAAGLTVCGVDADARGTALAARAYPGAVFATMLFAADPLALAAAPPGGWDCVTSTEVVEHLYSPHELPAFAFRALRPGGRFIITTPYHGYLKNLALSLADKWDTHHRPSWHGGHIKFWSFATLSALLGDAGFRVTHRSGIGRLPYLWKSMVIVAEKPV